MSGKLLLKRLFNRWIRGRSFTILTSFSGFLLAALIAFAIYDFVRTAKTKDEQVQTAALKSELAQFILGLREDDGFPLIENPVQLSRAARPIGVILLKKPLFGYLLNRGNAKSFETRKVTWEPPRSCVVEFSAKSTNNRTRTAGPVNARVCLAVVPGDTSGRFVYFSIRYPTLRIVHHIQGEPLGDSDHVTLTFRGEHLVQMNLVYEPPSLPRTRYPSQLTRFAGLHDITAYPGERSLRPFKGINAQAYEHHFDDGSGVVQNYVTILGRIDSALLLPSQEPQALWPTESAMSLKLAISGFEFDDAHGRAVKRFDIPFDAKGASLLSLEQLYVSQIFSKSSLEISDLGRGAPTDRRILWRSSEIIGLGEAPRPSLIQRFSDWWATQIVSIFAYERQSVLVKQSIERRGLVEATLRADPIFLPDIATRAFLWLWLALVSIVGLGVVWGRALNQLQRITQTAYKMTVWPMSDESLAAYHKRRDEIGMLGRTFNLLITRGRSRNARLIERMKRDQHERNEKIRIANEQVRSRQAVLDAIGHEIRSPLQALISKTPNDSELHNDIERMRRAVDALDFATSVESDFKGGTIVVKVSDIAEFLSRLQRNLSNQGTQVRYFGPGAGVTAIFDPITLDQVLAHLMNNAVRHKMAGTEIEISLQLTDAGATIEIYNQGPKIPAEELDSIFNYGFSSHISPENRGIGLFTARVYMLGMNGSLYAENRPNGVALVIILPTP